MTDRKELPDCLSCRYTLLQVGQVRSICRQGARSFWRVYRLYIPGPSSFYPPDPLVSPTTFVFNDSVVDCDGDLQLLPKISRLINIVTTNNYQAES